MISFVNDPHLFSSAICRHFPLISNTSVISKQRQTRGLHKHHHSVVNFLMKAKNEISTLCRLFNRCINILAKLGRYYFQLISPEKMLTPLLWPITLPAKWRIAWCISFPIPFSTFILVVLNCHRARVSLGNAALCFQLSSNRLRPETRNWTW